MTSEFDVALGLVGGGGMNVFTRTLMSLKRWIGAYPRVLRATLDPRGEGWACLVNDDEGGVGGERGAGRCPLPVFVAISVLLGSGLLLLVPARKYSGANMDKALVVMFLWLGFSLVADFLGRLLRGRGLGWAHPFSLFPLSAQIFAALYVVSGAISLAGALALRLPGASEWLASLGRFGDSLANNPCYIYGLSHFILFNIYLPVGAGKCYGLSRWRMMLVGAVLAMSWVLFALWFQNGRIFDD
jgi:hypothetical protein